MITSTRRPLVASLIVALSMAGVFMLLPVYATNYPCSSSASPSWQICGPIVPNNALNVQPRATQASDGSLRMVWTSRPLTSYLIDYSIGTWNGTGWSWGGGAAIASQPGTNQDPALVQLQNGTLMMFFSYRSTTSGHFQLNFIRSSGGAWSKYALVPPASSSVNDTLPSASVARDGTLWLTWTRDNSTTGSSHVYRQLLYTTLKGNVWSTAQPLTLTTDTNWNFQPSIVAGKDGIVRIVYSRGQSSTYFQIYYTSYNGVSWSSPVSLTSQTTTLDVDPSIAQDRNGTFWVFWARNLVVGTSTAYAVFARSSSDNGLSWTTEAQLTTPTCNSSTCVDSEYPSVVQSTTDKNLWVFYVTNPVSNFNIYGLKTTNPISPVHDVIIQYFSPNSTQQFAGGHFDTGSGINIYQNPIIQVLVVFQNLGDFSETVTLSLKATNTTNVNIGVQVLTASPGSSIPAYFNFNTTGVAPARYGIFGNASLPVETVGNKPDGILSTPNMIHLIPWGDIDFDGSDTITDVSVVFFNYGFTCYAPYNPATCSSRYISAQWGDINGNGVIDVVDASVAARNYGTYT